MAERPMWCCPECGRSFANRNQSHACGTPRLDDLFLRSEPAVRRTFDRVLEVVADIGDVVVVPEKTRVALQVRMSFAAFVPRVRWLDGHVILARAVAHSRFRRVESYSRHNHLHAFRLTSPADVDADVRAWLAEAYLVGAQQHLVSGWRARR